MCNKKKQKNNKGNNFTSAYFLPILFNLKNKRVNHVNIFNIQKDNYV